MRESPEFYRPLVHASITKVDAKHLDNLEPGIRLYCTQRGLSWSLQVRDFVRLANGQHGKDFIVASASQSRKDLLELRAAIDEALNAE